MASSPGEERVLIYVVIASLIFFIARSPELLRLSMAAASDDVSGAALFVTNLVGSFFFAPLMLYGLAALSHILARLFGGKGRFFDARLGLFWSLLLVSPLALVSTVVQMALPYEIVAQGMALFMFLLFSYVWASCLSVAEGFKRPYITMAAIILTAFGIIIVFRMFIVGQ
ncbi:MAG: YIP1 family protein [Rhodobacteraceae bacterium]|nr:YIP1 family protein [Paracoccaceae bacterium]